MPEPDVKLESDLCPMCSDGVRFDWTKTKFVTCTLCKGKGWIFTNLLCACSAPITTISAEKLLYCGRKECLDDLKADKNTGWVDDYCD